MASANNQATHGSCTLHTASQVQGAIQPRALPILALKTSSIQKLLCNSQFKHIPDVIFILSPGANHFFFSSPTKYNHPLFDLFTSVLLPFSVLYPSLPHSLLNNWQMEKNWLARCFCTHPRAPLRIASYLCVTEFRSRALSCTRTWPGWVAEDKSHQWNCSMSHKRSVLQPHRPPPKHRGKGQQQD